MAEELPQVTQADIPEIRALATPGAKEAANLPAEEKAQFAEKQAEATSFSAEDKLLNITKPPIEQASINRAVEANGTLQTTTERRRVENALMLAAMIDQFGFENLSQIDKDEAIDIVVTNLIRQQGYLEDRFPALLGKDVYAILGDKGIRNEAQNFLLNDKYRSIFLRRELEQSTDQRNFVKEDLNEAARAKQAAETRRNELQAEHAALEGRLNRAKTATGSFEQPLNTPGSKAEALQKATDEWIEAQAEVASIKVKLDRVNSMITMHQQRSLRDSTTVTERQVAYQFGQGTKETTSTNEARPLDNELASLQSESDRIAEALRDALSDQGKAEARKNTLEQEKAKARQDMDDETLHGKEAKLKGDLAQAEEEVKKTEREYAEADQARRVAEEAWMVGKGNILGKAALEYYKQTTTDAIQEQREILLKRAEASREEWDRGINDHLATRFDRSVWEERYDWRGRVIGLKEIGTKPVEVQRLNPITAFMETVKQSRYDLEIVMNQGVRAYLREALMDVADKKLQIDPAEQDVKVDKFLNDPANKDRIEEMQRNLMDTLLKRATVDKVITKPELARLQAQPWFQEQVKQSARNSPDPAVRNIPPAQVEAIIKQSGAQPDLLAALLKAIAGMMPAQELSTMSRAA